MRYINTGWSRVLEYTSFGGLASSLVNFENLVPFQLFQIMSKASRALQIQLELHASCKDHNKANLGFAKPSQEAICVPYDVVRLNSRIVRHESDI